MPETTPSRHNRLESTPIPVAPFPLTARHLVSPFLAGTAIPRRNAPLNQNAVEERVCEPDLAQAMPLVRAALYHDARIRAPTLSTIRKTESVNARSRCGPTAALTKELLVDFRRRQKSRGLDTGRATNSGLWLRVCCGFEQTFERSANEHPRNPLRALGQQRGL